MLLASGVIHDWDIEQMDVDTAFLNPVKIEEPYVEQPVGSVQDKRLVCKPPKYIYVWDRTFTMDVVY